jgi:hypothetical protein
MVISMLRKGTKIKGLPTQGFVNVIKLFFTNAAVRN